MCQRLCTAFAIWSFLGAALLSGAGTDLSVSPSENCAGPNQRRLSLSVQDKKGQIVDNLLAEDLTISENKASRELLKLERRTNEPLSVVLLIDTSASQERSLAGAKLAAHKFVESILRSDKDRAAIVSFTGKTTMEQPLTNDLSRLRAAIDRVKFVPPPGYQAGGIIVGRTPPSPDQLILGSTALWDALWTTIDGMEPAPDSRRVIVLLSDGGDTVSKMKRRDAIEYAASRDVSIFSVGIADDVYNLDRENLKRLSEETGGSSFFPRKVADLNVVLSETAQALQSRYLLSYCGANQNPSVKPIRIEIEVKNPQLRQSHLRLSYPRYAL
jgi:Ca-activated chloride channel homolog